MRKTYKKGKASYGYLALAKKYEVDKHVVFDIINRKTWTWA